MGRFLPISPQTLKGCRGQLDARISIKTGSIDRSAHEVDRLSSSRVSRSFPRNSRHLSSHADELPAPHKNVHYASPGVACWCARVAPPSDSARSPPTRPKASEETCAVWYASSRRAGRDGALSRQMGRWIRRGRQHQGGGEDGTSRGWRRASQPIILTSVLTSCGVSTMTMTMYPPSKAARMTLNHALFWVFLTTKGLHYDRGGSP